MADTATVARRRSPTLRRAAWITALSLSAGLAAAQLSGVADDLRVDYHLWRLDGGADGGPHFKAVDHLARPATFTLAEVTNIDALSAGMVTGVVECGSVGRRYFTCQFEGFDKHGGAMLYFAILNRDGAGYRIVWSGGKCLG